MNKNHLFVLFPSIIALAACDLFPHAPKEGNYEYIKQTETFSKSSYPSITYKDLLVADTASGGALNAIPGTGNVNLLVIPIEFSDYKFSTKTLSDINRCFNGNGASDTGYWESLSSFYSKSSFDMLNLNARISDVYKMNQTSRNFLSGGGDASTKVTTLVSNVVSWYKTNHSDIQDFDSDGDGFMDGVYLIYSCPDYITASAKGITISNEYWAYTSWLPKQNPSKSSPNPNNFIWASYDFMYSGLTETILGTNPNAVDSHTFIHETGHMLGLDDYYNYDADPDDTEYTNKNYKYYSPTGGLDMMDYNVLDHNAWSKFSLGWVKPYVIDKTTTLPLTLEINDSQSSGDFILIKDRDKNSEYNNSAFDEYMMVELYTPTGLNELDATQQYAESYPLGFTIPGVKITHIDARVGEFKKTPSGFTGDYVKNLTKEDLARASSSTSFNILSSNTPSYSSEDEGYRLIHLMESKGKNTFQNKNYEDELRYYVATDDTLFLGSQGRGFFTMDKFSSFFENKTKLNNGKPFPYTIKVNGIITEGSTPKASITIAEAK